VYWDDSKLLIEPYSGRSKVYYCGKELLRYDGESTLMYSLLIVDLEEAIFCRVWSDGEIERVFSLHSEVPHKMRVGGQSAPRFQRIRDNEITLWYKRLNEALKLQEGEVFLSINFVYKKRFLKTLSTYNKAKIVRFDKNEYSGLTGISQYIGKLEAEKKG